MIETLAADCKEQSNATDADLNDMIEGNLPKTQEAKCMSSCMLEQFQLVISNYSCDFQLLLETEIFFFRQKKLMGNSNCVILV